MRALRRTRRQRRSRVKPTSAREMTDALIMAGLVREEDRVRLEGALRSWAAEICHHLMRRTNDLRSLLDEDCRYFVAKGGAD